MGHPATGWCPNSAVPSQEWPPPHGGGGGGAGVAGPWLFGGPDLWGWGLGSRSEGHSLRTCLAKSESQGQVLGHSCAHSHTRQHMRRLGRERTGGDRLGSAHMEAMPLG